MEKIIINIDSKFRDINLYKNSSKFTIKLDSPIKNVTNIKISSIEFINLYNTNTNSDLKKNISFQFTFDNITTYNLEIDNGNYTSNSLISAIQNKLNYLLDDTNNKIYIILNAKGTVTITGSTKFNIIFNNNSIYPSLGYQLGFRNNNYTNIVTLISESLLNIQTDSYLYLKINDYGSIYTNLYTDNILSSSNILGKIILCDNNNNNKVFDNNNFITKEFIFRKPVTINKFDIELIDSYGNSVNTLIIDYSLTLELNYIYDFESNN